MAFDGDVAIVNRHMFLKENGTQDQKIENCYFEHIASGEILSVTDAEWPPHPRNPTDEGHQDVAVIRLKYAPTGGKPVPRKDIIIDRENDISKPISVVSNYAANLKKPESLTVTFCHKKGFYKLSSQMPSNKWATDCDTGEGSSGAQVYVEQDGKPKLIGIVEGENKANPEGGKFDAEKLVTKITQFDESLFDAYERLKKRTPL